MTNKELQDLLKQYPDCIEVCVDFSDIDEVCLAFIGCLNISAKEA